MCMALMQLHKTLQGDDSHSAKLAFKCITCASVLDSDQDPDVFRPGEIRPGSETQHRDGRTGSRVASLFRSVPEGKFGSRGLDGLEPQVARGGADAHRFLLVFEQG